jgi:hypothetical protein
VNLSTAIFLVNDAVRSVRVSYEPDVRGNPVQLFKTLDPSIAKGDIVIVPTDTRHKMTCVKVEEVDFGVDFDSAVEYRWVIGKVDMTVWETVQAQEAAVIAKVRGAEENRKRRELAAALSMDKIDFSGLSITGPSAPVAAPSSVFGSETPSA